MELNGTDAAKAALLAAMVEVQAQLPNVVRTEGATARDGRNYKYADLSSYLCAARAALKEHGLCVMAAPSSDANGSLTLHSIVAHKDGGTLTVVTPLVVGQYVDMQDFGSAVTYARRYVFSALFNFAVEDDDGVAAIAAPRNMSVAAHVMTVAAKVTATETVSPVSDRVAKIKAAPLEHLGLLTRLVASTGTPAPVLAAARQRVSELEAIVASENV